MRILVTGGAGYTGIPLCTQLLQDGHEVTILDNFMYGTAPLYGIASHPNLTIVRGDIRDERIDCHIAQDVIFHLAGISGYPACEANPGGARLINVDGTANLVRHLDEGQLLINASTTSFYGAKMGPSIEGDVIKPVNLYGETKLAAEKICMEREHAISLRWATVFGVASRMRDDLMVNDFVRRAIKDRVLVLYDPDSMRTFIHLHDQVRGYISAMETFESGIYNMGDVMLNLTKRQIAEQVSEYVPCEIIIAQTGDKDIRDFRANFDKAEDCGFRCEFPLRHGIAELVKLYSFADARGVI